MEACDRRGGGLTGAPPGPVAAPQPHARGFALPATLRHPLALVGGWGVVSAWSAVALWALKPPLVCSLFVSYALFGFTAMLHLLDVQATKDAHVPSSRALPPSARPVVRPLARSPSPAVLRHPLSVRPPVRRLCIARVVVHRPSSVCPRTLRHLSSSVAPPFRQCVRPSSSAHSFLRLSVVRLFVVRPASFARPSVSARPAVSVVVRSSVARRPR